MSRFSAFRNATAWCLALCLATLAAPVHAKRLALVMGNDNYVSVNRLQKAGNDADAMARELMAAGFTVTKHRDLNYRSMVKAIDAFSESITGGDEVVVFYAGHGVQIRAGAYLLPVDIEAENEAQVERTSYGLNDLTERLSEAKPAFTLVMVDACRDNPMKVKGRAVGNARGLNALEPPKGQMVVYSASRGQQALDRLSDNDSNPNGVFTREFISRMRTPGVKIEDLMRDVQDSVESLAKTVRHEQRPAVYNEARGNFYFYGPTTVQVQQGNDDSEVQTWAAAQAANSVAAYQTYLDAHPKGKYGVAAKIKLDAIKQSAEKPSSDTEAGLWAEVKATGTRDYLETYVEQYPKGRYVALARLELKKLDDAEKAKNAKLALEVQQAKQREEQQAQRLEQAAWVEAQKADTTNSYTAYLEKYPSGRFATQAKAAKQALDERIAAGKRAEEERVKAELAKKAEEDRLAAEAKRVAEERAKAEAVKRAEEERLAAQARKVEEQSINAELGKSAEEGGLGAGGKRVAEESLRAGSIKPDMALIPGGTFKMDSYRPGYKREASHPVTVRAFFLAKTKVTQGQWKAVMGENPSKFAACGDACPVENVSWNQVHDFIKALNFATGLAYRLPAEAEWEYAARAGTSSPWSFGNDPSAMGDYAWFAANSQGTTHPVATKKPNPWGLFDMHGNLWEMVEDCFHDTYVNAPADGSAWTQACLPQLTATATRRGGSWDSGPEYLRSNVNDWYPKDAGSNFLGFRLALDLMPELAKNRDVVQKTKNSLKTIKDCFSCPEMVYLAGGDFEMGSNLQPKEMPVHKVFIASFYIGKTEITQAQWQDVMGGNPSRFRGFGSNWPVESISWDDAQLYVQRLSKKTGKSYRLLSEAEWEFAAKGEDLGRWNFGDNDQKLFEFAWVGSNSKGTTQAVAQKKPNEFGLYDMYGNVEEWVADCYHDAYIGAPQNSSPWLQDCKGEYRVRRGGSWTVDPGEARSTARDFATPGLTRNYLGLRVARDP